MARVKENMAWDDIEFRKAVKDGDTECRVPPKGWWCSRKAGHEGPCAARPE